MSVCLGKQNAPVWFSFTLTLLPHSQLTPNTLCDTRWVNPPIQFYSDIWKDPTGLNKLNPKWLPPSLDISSKWQVPRFLTTNLATIWGCHDFSHWIESFARMAHRSQKPLLMFSTLLNNKDIIKDTGEQSGEEIRKARCGRAGAQELLFLWIWGVPPSWHVDMFTSLEALWILYFRDFCGGLKNSAWSGALLPLWIHLPQLFLWLTLLEPHQFPCFS